MAEEAELVAVIRAKDQASKVLKGVTGKIQGMSATLKKVGTGATIAGGAIIGALGVSAKKAAEFESGMSKVNSMMGLGREEFQKMKADVLDMSKSIGVNAVGASDALYQAISAGIPKENAIEFLAIASKAAIAGVTDTETAVDGLTTVMNAFKMPMKDTQKVADIMFTTVKGGKTTFDELSSSLFQVAPIAAASGVKFEEVSAALATMTKQGVPTAQATTQLRQAMVSLQKPTADMEKVIKGMGYESGQAMLDELGFAETLNKLRDSTGGSNEMLMKMFGSIEAGGAVLALTGANAETFNNDLLAMQQATEGAGAATEAFNIINEGAGRQFEKSKAAINAVFISIGQQLLPILTPLIQKIGEVVNKVSDWMKANPGLTKVIVIAAGAIGVLLTVLGPLLIILPSLAAGAAMLGTAFTVMLGPVGLIILAIAGLIAITVLIIKNWEKIVLFFKGMWAEIMDLFKGKIGIVLAALFPFIGIPLLVIANWEKIVGFFKDIWGNIKGIFTSSIDWIIKKINSLIEIFNKIGGLVGLKIPEIGLSGGGQTFGSSGVQSVSAGYQSFRGAGVSNVTVNVAGSVITERELTEVVREGLLKKQTRNVTTGIK